MPPKHSTSTNIERSRLSVASVNIFLTDSWLQADADYLLSIASQNGNFDKLLLFTHAPSPLATMFVLRIQTYLTILVFLPNLA